MAQIDLRNPPNEMPDIVGYKPENPLAANFEPYISARTRMRELTPVPLIIGTLLGIIFGASSLYLVLKVGLTVSASIPVAVISITLFRLFSKVGLRDATILENNIVQTAGSAGESIAFGVGVTMPAIMILGLDLEVTRVMLVAMLYGPDFPTRPTESDVVGPNGSFSGTFQSHKCFTGAQEGVALVSVGGNKNVLPPPPS